MQSTRKMKITVPRHIIIKLFTTSEKGNAFKDILHINRNKNLNNRFCIKNNASEKTTKQHLQSIKKKKDCQPRILYPTKILLNGSKRKMFSDIQKLKVFIPSRLVLPAMLKEVLQAEEG